MQLYIHIPYCRRKCLYCDFYSRGNSNPVWRPLMEALSRELSLRIPNELTEDITSIYIGGGTPSMIPPEIFIDLISTIRDIVGNQPIGHISSDCEITIEVNPDDVDQVHVDAWKRGGVNRISLGIQSLSADVLKSMGRLHSPQRALEALDILTSNFENVSADLIFGFPGQSTESVESDVKTLLGYNIKHISIYTLMYEPGTPLTKLCESGHIAEVADEVVMEQYELIRNMLSKAGFEHYEISNYARRGYRSRHNSGYWIFSPYIGIGPSAHSYDGDSIRRANSPDIRRYLETYCRLDKSWEISESGENGRCYSLEFLSETEKREEFIMLSLRRKEGLDLSEYTLLYGDNERNRLLKSAARHIYDGNLIIESDRIHLSETGFMLSDSVIVDLL